MDSKVKIKSECRFFGAEVVIQKIGNPVYIVRGKFIPDDNYIFVNHLEKCELFWPDGRKDNIVVGGNYCIGDRKFEFYFIVR